MADSFRASGWAVTLAAALALGCGGAAPVPPPASGPVRPWFADVTDDVGLHFLHDAGPPGNHFMPQSIGSGAALFDFDGDLYGQTLDTELVAWLRGEETFDGLDALKTQIDADAAAARTVLSRS